MVGPSAEWRLGETKRLRTETKIFIYLFNKYFLSPYYVLGAVLSLRDKTLNKLNENPCPQGAYILVGGKAINRKVSKI